MSLRSAGKKACCILVCAVLFACGGGADGSNGRDASPGDAADVSDVAADADAGAPAPVCDPDDPDPLGPACLQLVDSDEVFDSISIGPTGVQHWERATKYMVPAVEDQALIPPLVQNAHRYPLHMEFLTSLFLPGLTLGDYAALINERATRQYYAGNLVRITVTGQDSFYGFTVYTSAKQSELLEPVEVQRIYDQLSAIVTAGPLAYTFEPFDAMGPAKARAWIDPGFPIWFPLAQQEVNTEVYTSGTAYGYVRCYTLAEFEAAVAEGLLGWRDIVVVDSVPFDLEPVVAALVTGGRQWELSHVNVRLGRRGTPNLYVKDALAELGSWSGALVRLEAVKGTGGLPDTWAVAEAEEPEAQAWWAAHRPLLEDVPAPDPEFSELLKLTEMDVDDQPVRLVSRVGGKAANLAKLYAFLDPGYQVPGFGIPFSWFEQLLDENTIMDNAHQPPEQVSLREFISRLAASPQAASDAAYRHGLLAQLRAAIKDEAEVPPGLEAALLARLAEVFGGSAVPVRFRSSSNIEDSLEFSGSGLYSSTTVCAADSQDEDSSGPSLCNPAETNERTVARGLRTVWASLFNDRAWDERDWYQVPQGSASMAILVTLAFPDEAANGVAFTGNPSDPTDPRYVINSQVGDEKVVSNDPSKVPELVRLELTDGQVTWISRVRSSSLAKPGVPVMSDAQLKELGGLMAQIDLAFPLDLGGHDRGEVLLDLEFKVQKESLKLKIKQIRPFLMNIKQE